ncbi:MAG: hypothetical protein JNK82_01235 [Myxococcaceae bacterium]|nr:hypothetical protein [Myxococcaceae bacterium]
MSRRWSWVVLAVAACDVGPGGSGGAGGGTGSTAGGQGGTGGGSTAQTFACSQLKNSYELTATNRVTGLCEPGAKVPVTLTANGCAIQFSATVAGNTFTGSCTLDSSGACTTTVSAGAMTYPASFQFGAGATTGTGSLGPTGMSCTYDVAVLATLGKLCHCQATSGTVTCTNAPECSSGETCTQEDDGAGAFCAPPMSACTSDFEPKTVNGIAMCTFKKKRGACTHSAQCESCASGTAGVTVSAGCFGGQCRMKCSGTGGACGCMAGTAMGGTGTGYCSSMACQ